jgi:hypothetical protein
MKLSHALVLVAAATALVTACAPAAQQQSTPGGGLAPAGETRSNHGLDVIVQIADSTARTATQPHDIALVAFENERQVPLGCTRIASMALVSPSAARMREAVLEKGGEIGATLVAISRTQQLRQENGMSRTGKGIASVRVQYAFDAFDCR